jgi:hypothetical protein
MTKGEKFRTKASAIIKKFAEENGLSTYHEVTSLPATSYNPSTGTDTPVLVEHTCYMAFDVLMAGLMPTAAAAVVDPEFFANHRLALIAGADLTVTPEEGGFVTPAGGTGKFRIAKVETDMYGALYTCYIARKPE